MENIYNKTVTDIMLKGNYITESLNSFFKIHDLTVQQYNILCVLKEEEDDEKNLRDLQSYMLHKTSNTTRLVEKLRKKGLVTRKVCENNRRKVNILITDKGIGLLDGIEETLLSYKEKLVNGLTNNELFKLLELLNKIK